VNLGGRRQTVEIYAPSQNAFGFAMTLTFVVLLILKTFAAMPTRTLITLAKCHWNSSNKWTNIAACGIVVSRTDRRPNGRPENITRGPLIVGGEDSIFHEKLRKGMPCCILQRISDYGMNTHSALPQFTGPAP